MLGRVLPHHADVLRRAGWGGRNPDDDREENTVSELVSITVGGLLEQVARQYPDDQAIKYIDRPFDMTWKEFDDEVNRIAKGFLAMGLGRGDHIAIWATNVPEWLLALFASV